MAKYLVTWDSHCSNDHVIAEVEAYNVQTAIGHAFQQKGSENFSFNEFLEQVSQVTKVEG